MSRSKTYKDLQKLLIEPTDRIKFVVKFSLVLSIGNLAIAYFCTQVLELLSRENNLLTFIFSGVLAVSIIGLFIGSCSGIVQWTLLRKYFNREWIIAIAICGIYFGLRFLRLYLNPIDAFNYPNQEQTQLYWALALDLLLAILSIALLIAQGFIQKLALKHRIEKDKWLLFLPLISSYFLELQYLPIAGLLWLIFKKYLNTGKRIFLYLISIKLIDFFLLSSIWINFLPIDSLALKELVLVGLEIRKLMATAGLSLINMDIDGSYSFISSILIFSTIQSLVFCLFNRQSFRRLELDEDSIFASTPDFDRFAQVKSAMNKVGFNINNLWQGDFNYSSKLTYWLAVLLDGTVAAYYPLDRVSEDNFSNSPLNLLTENQNEPLNINHTAKLQVTFAPPGKMEINSLSAIPVSLLFLGTYLLLVATSMGASLILQRIS